MVDRRRVKRYTTDCNLPAIDEEDLVFVGVIKNISLNGIMIKGERGVPEGKEIIVRVLGDDKYGGHIRCDFVVPVRLIWSEKRGNFYYMGFEFAELPRDALTSVRHILDIIG
jgi:hypothetical protein